MIRRAQWLTSGDRTGALIEQFAGDTLGTLVRTMFETFLVSDSGEPPALEDRLLTADAIHFSSRVTLEMSSEQLQQAPGLHREWHRARRNG